ncbi:MAG TPA: YebC/PmpR family DNA-binding transcriptional regulator, partial [Gemmatimonadaceae bacterium]|nr:YebC/PmpR family DNA-binding transcriptional regulator [Gemmatimonadaceae bacterium]
PADLHAVKQALEAAGLVASEAELTWVPKSSVRVEGENATQLLKLMEQIEDLDDVQKVDANFDMDMSEMSA